MGTCSANIAFFRPCLRRKGAELELRLAALKDARMRVALGPKALPSCLAYTLFNATRLERCGPHHP